MSVIKHVIDNVSPVDYYQWQFPNLSFHSGENRIHSPWVGDKTPSLMINGTTGAWNHFCGTAEDHFGGNDIVSFHAKLHDVKKVIAAKEIYSRYVHPTIPRPLTAKWARTLKNTPLALKYVKQVRFLDAKILKKLRIGWDGTHITMPIENEFGLFINAKRYDFTAKNSKRITRKFRPTKMLNYSDMKKETMPDGSPRKFGSPAQLYPMAAMKMGQELGWIIVCEGEWDALFLYCLGLPAVTSTAGSKSWCKQYNHMFRGLDVTVIYDNDSAGVLHKKKFLIPNLMKYAKTIKDLMVPRLKMPTPKGEDQKYTTDVVDWATVKSIMRKKKAWENQIKHKSKLLVENEEKDIIHHDIEEVPLDKASMGKYYHKQIRTNALVSGKINSPYIIPKKYRVTCAQRDDCETCPLRDLDTEFKESVINESDPEILHLIDISDKSQREILQKKAGFTKTTDGCKCRVETVSSFNVEKLVVIPTLDSDSKYTNRFAYYTGHGIDSNKAYQFEGTTTSAPRTQHAVHLFNKAKPVEGEVDTFVITPELNEQLKVFKPQGKETVLKKLNKLADWRARNVTSIKERPDLHMAVDMSFFSVKEFTFNREFLGRGMMDVLVLGDGATGKGWVQRYLSGYYGLGAVVTGENCSVAGLIGGIQSKGNEFMLTWGAIPLNNGRHLTIDEANELSYEDWGRLSRIRSEGIAEINKIITESTQANTRLLFLANPRSGKQIMSYNTGMHAIKELVGANEDIRRFDVALTVATDEVSGNLINTLNDVDHSDSDKYPPELARALVLWCWSRTNDQVKFTEGAEKEIIKQAIKFGEMYSSEIPLVQRENVRFKICKWAIWAAASLFSASPDGEDLVVQRRHVRAACQVVSGFYNKESMGYEMFSNQNKPAQSHTSYKKIEKAFKHFGDDKKLVIDGLMTMHYIDVNGLSDYTSGDNILAKQLISSLVQAKCLQRGRHGYSKSKDFAHWLREQGSY